MGAGGEVLANLVPSPFLDTTEKKDNLVIS